MSDNKALIRIVLIPGLGYDRRIFKNLDLSNFHVEYLDWIEPQAHEKIHDYAQRLFSSLDDSSQKTILIGHSLGGIVSQEIASVHKIEKVILISAIKSRKELPLYFKIVKPLRLHKLFTKKLCIQTVKYWGKSHGIIAESDQELFRSMLAKQTNSYLQWALRALSTWHEPTVPPQTKIIHIHGTNDKTLPYRLVNQPNFTIENGSHICVFKKAKELSVIINDVLQDSITSTTKNY